MWLLCCKEEVAPWIADIDEEDDWASPIGFRSGVLLEIGGQGFLRIKGIWINNIDEK